MTRTFAEKGVQHLFAAVIVLSTGADVLDERLRQARRCLQRIVVETDLPAGLSASYRELMTRLDRLYADGAAPARRDQAAKLARDVVRLYERAVYRDAEELERND